MCDLVDKSLTNLWNDYNSRLFGSRLSDRKQNARGYGFVILLSVWVLRHLGTVPVSVQDCL